MKIVHVIGYFQPKIGYQEYYLAKTQKENGHDVYVITSDRYFPFNDYEQSFGKILGPRIRKSGFFKEEGIKTIRLPTIFENGTIIAYKSINKLLKHINPDIIFIHGLFSYHAFVVILKLKKRVNQKIIIDEHMLPPPVFQKEISIRNIVLSLFIKIYCFLIRKFFLKKIDLLFGTNRIVSKWLMKTLNIKNIPTFELGVDTTHFSPLVPKAAVNSIKEKSFVLGYTGKLIPNKGLEKLLEISNIIMERYDNVQVLFIGNGKDEYVQYLNSIVKPEFRDRVIFHQGIPHSEFPHYLKNIHIAFWLGSIPSASMEECLSMGIPIVVSNMTNKTYLARKNSGSFAYHNNEEELLEWLCKNIEDFHFYQQNSKKARKYALTYYDWKKINRMIIESCTKNDNSKR